MRKFTVYDIYSEIMLRGSVRRPRGLEIRELLYFQGQILDPFSNYTLRKYPLDYFKREMQWYLHADDKDHRILKHASAWKKLIQSNGSILSNYGQYWFGWQNGFQWVVDTLSEDVDSRQAYIPMNSFEHAFKGNLDFVCTKGIKFDIINGLLNIHVSMRSSDAVYGLATDLPCFWVLWEMVSCELNVPRGRFIFSSDSIHIYEKHYEMIGSVLSRGPGDIIPVNKPNVTDASDLINEVYESEFGKWLTEVDL